MQYFNLLIHKQLLYETERKIEMNKKVILKIKSGVCMSIMFIKSLEYYFSLFINIIYV